MAEKNESRQSCTTPQNVPTSRKPPAVASAFLSCVALLLCLAPSEPSLNWEYPVLTVLMAPFLMPRMLGIVLAAVALIMARATRSRSFAVVALVAVSLAHCYAVVPQNQLLDAAARGDLEGCESALSRGADVNYMDDYGYGPLHKAAEHGHCAVLEYLLERGGNVNARKGSSRNTPLIMAASRGHVDCCELLVDNGAKADEFGLMGGTRHTALQVAAERGQLDVVHFFLDRGHGPNERIDDVSALHRACKRGHLEVVRALVAAGANTRSTEKRDGSTPLQVALKEGHDEIVAFLRQQNESWEDQQRENERQQFGALHASFKKGTQELVVEAYIWGIARFIVDDNGLHWESAGGYRKPGTNRGEQKSHPTYIDGVARYPRWSTGLYDDMFDQSDPWSLHIPSVKNVEFQLLGVGKDRDAYTMAAEPNIKVLRDGAFTVVFAEREMGPRWYKFRLFWK